MIHEWMGSRHRLLREAAGEHMGSCSLRDLDPRGRLRVESSTAASVRCPSEPAPVNCQQNISVNRCRIFHWIATFNWPPLSLSAALATWRVGRGDHQRHWQSELAEKYWAKTKFYIFTTARPTTWSSEEGDVLIYMCVSLKQQHHQI